MTRDRLEFRIDRAPVGKRLDAFLAEAQDRVSRSRIKKLIEDNRVSVNGQPARAKYKLKSGDFIQLEIPPTVASQTLAEPIALQVVYEDASLLVVDKPAGMVVHPAPGHASGTLVNAVLGHCKDLSGIGGTERPGIVHRLDKDTSGLVIVAKNDAAHQSLTRQFKDRSIEKTYLALVWGKMRLLNGTIDSSIGRNRIHRKKMATNVTGGREAKTRYEVVERYRYFTYLRLKPETGRTHQIRVHLASIHHPVLGDKLYGGNKVPQGCRKIPRQALHAHSLKFHHPSTGKTLCFEAPLAPDMESYLNDNRDNKIS